MSDLLGSAVLSDDRVYRYSLSRWWSWSLATQPLIVIGLNPSTADESVDDPTIRRCVGFARREGLSSLLMLNLFAYRATDPKNLKAASGPIGLQADATLRHHCEGHRVVAAWGTHGGYMNRDRAVLDLLADVGAEVMCFGTTKDGFPKHPLYLKSDTPLVQYGGRA